MIGWNGAAKGFLHVSAHYSGALDNGEGTKRERDRNTHSRTLGDSQDVRLGTF